MGRGGCTACCSALSVVAMRIVALGQPLYTVVLGWFGSVVALRIVDSARSVVDGDFVL